LTLETKDGVQLSVEYLPGTPAKGKTGKDVVPVVLLHMAKGSGADWKPLAEVLYRAGHAVIVPDLRGHGKSTEVKRGGRTLTIDQATMRRGDFEAMVTQDLEQIKRFIIQENNEERLNLRKLCVIGAEMGAVVALNWAALDWSWPPLATGPQGQDVNGLVLITPIRGHMGMTIDNASKHPGIQRSISMAIIVGSKDSSNLRDAQRLHRMLEQARGRTANPANKAPDEEQDLWFERPSTSLQGTKMLGQKSLGVEQAVLRFIQLRLAGEPIPWARRDRALE
jgi:alpha-beta hydrolase superfamily lysophospholipase